MKYFKVTLKTILLLQLLISSNANSIGSTFTGSIISDESIDIQNLLQTIQFVLNSESFNRLKNKESIRQILKQSNLKRNEFFKVLADELIKKIGVRARPKYG